MVEKNKKVKINFSIPRILPNSKRKSYSENSFFPKNHKGWIRIVEAFVAILLITGVLLIILNQGYIGKKDISAEIYKIERSILKEIQLDDELRNDILNTNPPVTWDDTNFPLDVKNKIISRLPSYLNCEAKICTINEVCILDMIFDREIYAQSVSIIAQLTKYNPRQLKLFCWVGVAPGVEYLEEQTCLELGGTICIGDEICPEAYLEASDSAKCCPVVCEEPPLQTCLELGGDICIGDEICSGIILNASDSDSCCSVVCEEPALPKTNLTLLFSDTVYELKFNVEIDGIVYFKVYYYYHTRTFNESNGVGVNLTEGQICYSDGSCDSKGIVDYRIEPNATLIHTDKRFWTTSDEETFTLNYWGTDDNGYDVYINQSMCVQKSQFTENCVV